MYATASVADAKALRAHPRYARGMDNLMLQTLAEFANVAIRKAGTPIEDIRLILQSVRFVNPF